MKFMITLLLSLVSQFLPAQQGVVLDTITQNFKVDGFIEVTSSIPQIMQGSNSVARELINADISHFFQASRIKDNTTEIRPKSQPLEHELNETGEEIGVDDEREGFQISYISENLMSFVYTYQVLPAGGRYQFFFESAHYDLRTGKNLEMQDFLTITDVQFIDLLKQKGYRISQQSDADQPVSILPVDPNDEYLEINIPDLFAKDGLCADFYFIEDAGELHLRIAMKCAGPHISEYGISMVHLKPWIEYSEFKNRYRLWGKDIHAAMGMDFGKFGNEVVFQDYVMVNTGSGYALDKTGNDGQVDFSVAFCHAAESIFYLFLHHQTMEGKKVAIILDVLEIDRKCFKKCKMIEYCYLAEGEPDSEILALVRNVKSNPEYYNKVQKAWRANRLTGKFESVDKGKVKRCYNESFGL